MLKEEGQLSSLRPFLHSSKRLLGPWLGAAEEKDSCAGCRCPLSPPPLVSSLCWCLLSCRLKEGGR